MGGIEGDLRLSQPFVRRAGEGGEGQPGTAAAARGARCGWRERRPGRAARANKEAGVRTDRPGPTGNSGRTVAAGRGRGGGDAIGRKPYRAAPRRRQAGGHEPMRNPKARESRGRCAVRRRERRLRKKGGSNARGAAPATGKSRPGARHGAACDRRRAAAACRRSRAAARATRRDRPERRIRSAAASAAARSAPSRRPRSSS